MLQVGAEHQVKGSHRHKEGRALVNSTGGLQKQRIHSSRSAALLNLTTKRKTILLKSHKAH